MGSSRGVTGVGGSCPLAAWVSNNTHPSISDILFAFSCYPEWELETAPNHVVWEL